MLTNRRKNRGAENVAVSPDGTKAYMLLQVGTFCVLIEVYVDRARIIKQTMSELKSISFVKTLMMLESL